MSKKSLRRISLAFAGIVAAAAWPVSSMAEDQGKKQKQQQSGSTSEETGAYGSGEQGSGASGEQGKTGAYGSGMQQQQRMLDSKGQDFLKSSAQESMGIVQMSKIAQQKATSPAVRQYAQGIVSESQNMDKQLQHLATQNNVSLPTSVDDEMMQKQRSMQGMSGKDFERQYLDTVISQRQDNIGKFVEMAENRDAPPQVRTFAIQSLPTLRMQVMQAQNIQQQVSGQGGQGQGSQQERSQQRGGQ